MGNISITVSSAVKEAMGTNLIEVSMTSLEIAGLTGKRHPDVRRDIRVMMNNLELDVSKFAQTYMDASNRPQEMYTLTEELANNLVLGYSDKRRLAVIQELKAKHEALVSIRDEATTIEEAKEIATDALRIQRDGLRNSQWEFNNIITHAYNEGTFNAPTVSAAISNANKLPSIIVLGNQPSTIEKKTGLRPRDHLVATEDAVGLQRYSETIGQVKILAAMGFDYKTIKEHLERLRTKTQ